MLAHLLTQAVAAPLPELDVAAAAKEAVPAMTIRFRGVATYWLRVRGEALGLSYDSIIRGVVTEIMTDGQDCELQKLLREAASEPLPDFALKDDDGKPHALTVRLSAAERHWLEHRGAALNMPASVLIGFLIQQYAKADIAAMNGMEE